MLLLDDLVNRTIFLDKETIIFESSDNVDIEDAYKRLFLQV